MSPARAITLGATGMLVALVLAAVVAIAARLPTTSHERPYTSPPGPVPTAPPAAER